MPRGIHNNPFLGWNPPAEDSAWARAEAGRREVKLSTILTEALQEYRAKHQGGDVSPPRARKPREKAAPAARFVAADQQQPQPDGQSCPHPKGSRLKGRCTRCKTFVGFE